MATGQTGETGDPFLTAWKGSFTGILRWPQLEALWARVRARAHEGWYVYAIGEAPPTTPAEPGELDTFLTEIDRLLRSEHAEDYCGIVYADDPEHPTLIKIYDPNNLGMVCGSSAQPPLPGWVLSTLPPSDLRAAMPPAAGRRRWWRRIFGRSGT